MKKLFKLAILLVAAFGVLTMVDPAAAKGVINSITSGDLSLPKLSWPISANASSETAESVAESTPCRYFELIQSDVTYTEAEQLAEEAGGRLAVINSEEDWNELVAVLNEQIDVNGSLQYVWFSNDSEQGSFSCWYPGERSYYDQDGTEENCLSIWCLGGSWSWNDQRDALPSVAPEGSIWYAIEYNA